MHGDEDGVLKRANGVTLLGDRFDFSKMPYYYE